MDILRIFRMQEPISKALLTKNNESGQGKCDNLQNDTPVPIANKHDEKVIELENEIAKLKEKCIDLERRSNLNAKNGNEYHDVLMNYDDFFKKVWDERNEVVHENAVLEQHISNLEKGFNDLLEKYGKARNVIHQLVENQNNLLNHLEMYKQCVKTMQKRFEDVRTYSQSKITEANEEIGNREKDNIKMVANLKAKILESEAKINELEKFIKFEDICPRQSMFAPLKNNITC